MIGQKLLHGDSPFLATGNTVHLSLGSLVAAWGHPVFGRGLVLHAQIASSTCLPRIQRTWCARSARSAYPERWDHRLGDSDDHRMTSTEENRCSLACLGYNFVFSVRLYFKVYNFILAVQSQKETKVVPKLGTVHAQIHEFNVNLSCSYNRSWDP